MTKNLKNGKKKKKTFGENAQLFLQLNIFFRDDNCQESNGCQQRQSCEVCLRR